MIGFEKTTTCTEKVTLVFCYLFSVCQRTFRPWVAILKPGPDIASRVLGSPVPDSSWETKKNQTHHEMLSLVFPSRRVDLGWTFDLVSPSFVNNLMHLSLHRACFTRTARGSRRRLRPSPPSTNRRRPRTRPSQARVPWAKIGANFNMHWRLFRPVVRNFVAIDWDVASQWLLCLIWICEPFPIPLTFWKFEFKWLKKTEKWTFDINEMDKYLKLKWQPVMLTNAWTKSIEWWM